MEDLAFDHTPSTVLEPDSPTNAVGSGTPKIEAEPSLRDIIANEVKEDAKAPKEPVEAPKDDKAKEAEAKPEKDAKPAEAKPEDEAKADKTRAPDGKFAKPAEPEVKAEAEGEVKPEDDKGERRHVEAPKNFLPKAKELWRNTPQAVQQEVDRIIREHDDSVKRYEETDQRYSRLRDFDDLARSNGRDLRESLTQVHQFETMMQQNPIAALNMALMQVGPRKADGQPVSLMEVAQYIVQQGPQGYQQLMQAAQQQQQPQQDPEVARLKQELQEVRDQQIIASVVTPFQQSHPRYEELEQDIALFLASGKIPTSLSPAERLAAAYDMAERINPPSHAAEATPASPAEPRRADNDFSGSKSIKSAPGAVSPDMEPERGGSIRDLLEDELRRQKRA